jgi:hypothetical protein
MSFKKSEPALQFGGQRVSADEMDMVRQYVVLNPTVDPIWFGTAIGTSTQGTPMGLINKNADYPRNLAYAVAAPAGSTAGGTWIVNGKNQFGETIQETVIIGTATGGGTVAGTKVFAQVTSGTINFTTMSPGNGSARLGVAIGTAAGLVGYFGLPDKIAAISDVKSITWRNVGTSITLNGGTVDSSLVGTANHTFNGTAVMAVTDGFLVNYRSTYPAQENVQTL